MTDIKYSVIIPHYGKAFRLERLLRSIPVIRPDIEVIVVDDCTPDQTELDAVRRRWTAVRWMSTRENIGAGAARNVGLAHAQGNWLVFADSDDEFLPAAFDSFDNHLLDCDELVFFLADALQELNGLPSSRANRVNDRCRNYLKEGTDKALQRLKLGSVVPWAKVYSRAFIESIGVRFEETRVSNDVSFNVLAAVQAKNVRVVDVKVYRVYRREESLTSTKDLETLLNRVKLLARLNQELSSLGFSDRMHAGGYLFRAARQGPMAFLKVFQEAASRGLLRPSKNSISFRELVGSFRRSFID